MLKCFDCGKEIEGTKCGIYASCIPVCYECCANRDKEYMRTHDKITLYLSEEKVEELHMGKPYTCIKYTISNWPGSLIFKPYRLAKGKHNISRTRIDVWFTFEGKDWWGVNYGENSQILHCKKLKG